MSDISPRNSYKKNPVGRPPKINREITKTSQEGLSDNWTRYTVIVREDLLEQLKDHAWTERKTIKTVVNNMLEDYLKDKVILERNED